MRLNAAAIDVSGGLNLSTRNFGLIWIISCLVTARFLGRFFCGLTTSYRPVHVLKLG